MRPVEAIGVKRRGAIETTAILKGISDMAASLADSLVKRIEDPNKPTLLIWRWS